MEAAAAKALAAFALARKSSFIWGRGIDRKFNSPLGQY